MIKSKRLRSAFLVARMDEGRPRRRWEDNIRMDLKEIGFNTRNWIDSAQDRDYWRAFFECDIEPLGSISHVVS